MSNIQRLIRFAWAGALALSAPATPVAATLTLGALPDALRIDGLADGDLLGISAGRLGDFNGDGIDDFVVAAEHAHGGRGSAYVIHGRVGGLPPGFSLAALDGRNGFRIDGGPGEGFNARARGAGDLNADGYGDLVLAHASADGFAGRVCVVFGGRPSPAIRSVAAIESGDMACFRGSGAHDNTGREVAALGDVNGDGIDDLAIGAPLADFAGIDSGSVYVVFGRIDGFAPDVDLAALDGRDGWRIDGAAAGDGFGLAVAAAGDIDADGDRDLVIGAELAAGAAERAGAAYVVFGRDDAAATRSVAMLAAADGFRIVGDALAYGRFGRKVAGGGDVDGDGIDDLVVGAPYASGSGAAYVIHGRRGGFPATVTTSRRDAVADGFAAGAAAGDGVALIGDIDDDGVDEVAIGAQRADAGGGDAGAVQIVFGAAGRGAPVRDPVMFEGSGAGAYCGLETRAIGDIDADGRDELLVSCHAANAGGHWRGSVHIVRGGAFDRHVFANGFE